MNSILSPNFYPCYQLSFKAPNMTEYCIAVGEECLQFDLLKISQGAFYRDDHYQLLSTPYLLPNQRREVGGNVVHPGGEISAQLFPVLCQVNNPRRKPLNVDEINRRDIHA